MERRTLHNSVNASNPYKGRPSAELDLAWHNLLRRTSLCHEGQKRREADRSPDGNIRLSAQELREMGKTSVELADGSGDYIGGLGGSPQASWVADMMMTERLTRIRCVSSVALLEVYPALHLSRPLSHHQDECAQSGSY